MTPPSGAARRCPPPMLCPALDGVTLQRLDRLAHLPPGAHALCFVGSGGIEVGSDPRRCARSGQVLLIETIEPAAAIVRIGRVEGWLLAVGDRCPEASACATQGCGPAWTAGYHTLLRSVGTIGEVAVSVDDPDWWVRELSALEHELHGDLAGRTIAVRARVELLLISAARLHRPDPAVCRATSDLVADALAVVAARFREPLMLRDIAAEVGCSATYLTDRVRRETGAPLGAWIRTHRLGEARRLLVETALPVAVVGHTVGYPDPTHFARVFRSATGVTPTTWRARERTAGPTEASADSRLKG